MVARSDNTLSLLTPNAEGQLTESLIFRDPRLQDPSALAVVNVGGQEEIYVTNAGQNDVVVIPFSEGVSPDAGSSIAQDNHQQGNPGLDNPGLGNPELTDVGPTGPLFAFKPDEDSPLPTFNTGQLEGGAQRGQSADLQPVDNADLALAATLRTGTTEEMPEEQGAAGSGFVVGLDSSGLGRAVTALLVGVEEAGPDDDTNAEGGAGATEGDGTDGAQADQSTPMNEFLKGVDDAIHERKQDVEPGQPETDARTLSAETLYAALDALFGGQEEQPGPADLSHPDAGQEESMVLALTRERLGLAAPAPTSHSLQDVLGEVASALGTEPAPTAQAQEVQPGSALFEEAGPPALLSTSLSPLGEIDKAPPALPPVAGPPDMPSWDVSASLPAVEPAKAGTIPWEPALLIAGWAHACLRDQAAPVRDRKQSPAGPKVTRP